jgi:hypothetical protein
MCNAVERFAQETLYPVAVAVGQHIHFAHDKTLEGAQWLGRQIHDWTHALLPRPVAVITEAFLQCLPFFYINVCLPTSASLAALAGVVIYKMITVPRGQPVTAPEFENGMGFGRLWTASSIVAGTAASGGGIGWALVNFFAAFMFFGRSGLLEDFIGPQAAPAPEPVPGPVPANAQ